VSRIGIAYLLPGLGSIAIAAFVIVNFQYTPILMTVVTIACFLTFTANYVYQKRLNQMEQPIAWDTRTRKLIQALGALIFLVTIPVTIESGDLFYLWGWSLVICVLVVPFVFGLLGILLAQDLESKDINQFE
jgi:peptidoglycan/LPS O-acetylase OafA/YrhL